MDLDVRGLWFNFEYGFWTLHRYPRQPQNRGWDPAVTGMVWGQPGHHLASYPVAPDGSSASGPLFLLSTGKPAPSEAARGKSEQGIPAAQISQRHVLWPLTQPIRQSSDPRAHFPGHGAQPQREPCEGRGTRMTISGTVALHTWALYFSLENPGKILKQVHEVLSLCSKQHSSGTSTKGSTEPRPLQPPPSPICAGQVIYTRS
ncbi:PREDICTED: uncharacterized protein LOC105519877 [Colobus angolensis palliatus]|uniref:uncharacterized protein LOC105519877 n=1 Tax=Colobus angolensis palliatus TaxID=336983 RepID=UPI0005F4A477|nr:PREDICTED: uncharacterized protein LOC105519877 [Colobus angolensis palliatus]